jgi:hypothetical protein
MPRLSCLQDWKSQMFFRKFTSRGLLAAAAVWIAGCGGGGGGTPAAVVAPAAQSNVLAVSVDAGPAGTGYNVNRLYTNVTVCQPGSTTVCQTIDHVLVDTGSTGLRVLASQVPSAIGLMPVLAGGGQPLLNCVQFLDASFGWGPVVVADIVMGEKRAVSVPVQLMGDPATNARSASCASGTALTTMAELGAKAILGVDMFKADCGTSCATNSLNGYYYTCTDASCAAVVGTTADVEKQVKHPVPLLASDNNGLLIDLPSVPLNGAAGANGRLIFGIGTQDNNQQGAATVLTTSSTGLLTAEFEGRTLRRGFVDTGSNGFFFDTATVPQCGSGATGFYCPSNRTQFALTMAGANRATVPVVLTVDNALALFSSYPNAAFPTLAGTIGDNRIMDLGLPFFYGRRVFIGIEGQASLGGIGPFYAF